MKIISLHFSNDNTPVQVRIHASHQAAADITIAQIEHTVFRHTPADLRAWLTDLRDKIDAALAAPAPAPDPVPQHASSPSAADMSAVALAKADAAGGASPPAPAAGSADTQAEARDV